jgi:cell division septation protein DedD
MPSRQRSGASETSSRFSPFRQAFTFQLSLVSLLGICLVALIGAGWIFAFGVIIGRGFDPDQKMPGFGRLAPPSAEAPALEPGGIIRPEDLTFHENLKTPPTLSTEQPVASPAKPEVRPAEPKKPDKPAPQAQVQIQRPTASVAPGAAGAAGAPPGAVVLEPRYDFVLQVIAYKKADQAEAFRDKLENAGLRTRLQTEKDQRGNPRIYRVQVLLKGTEADAEQVRTVLARYGVKETTVALRKPI